MELLIPYEPDVNVKNYDGRTALGECRMHNNEDLIELLDKKYVFVEADVMGKLYWPDGTVQNINVSREPVWNTGGWEERVTDNGDTYYYNLETKESRTDKPDELGGDWRIFYDTNSASFMWYVSGTWCCCCDGGHCDHRPRWRRPCRCRCRA